MMKRFKPTLITLIVASSIALLFGSFSMIAHGQFQEQKPPGANDKTTEFSLDYKCKEGVSELLKVVPLPSGRMLAGISNTLYMKRSHK
jgi:hypothetical protein